MVLSYTSEQYAVAAKTVRDLAPAAPNDFQQQALLVAASASEEVLKLAEWNRHLRRIIADAGHDLLQKLDHMERFSS